MFKWLQRRRQKSTGTNFNSILSEFLKLANASWMKKDYRTLAREGYEKNVVAFHCISKISKAVADVPFIVQINGKEVENDKITQLLKRPNPTQSFSTFMRLAVTHKLISGNAYILGNKVSTGRIMELQLLRPDRVCIETNGYDIPIDYLYTIAGKQWRYIIDPVTLMSEVLHIKEPNPLCDLYGMSPISAAAMSVDQHNESSEWNKKLLENSARPPGVLTLKDKGDSAMALTKEQKDELREEINDKFAGYRNAGKIPILTFDMEWRNMGMSPTDMDWLNGKNSTARDICLAFGYPPFLLGMPEGATYNNVSEAKLALYEETIIPLVQNFMSEISHFLSTHQNQNITIVPNLDKVSALAPRRDNARKNARDDVTAGIITINEARAENDYDRVEGGDDILVPSNKLPLNFDLTNMDQNKFSLWLENEGFTKEDAQKFSKIAYINHETKADLLQ